MRIMVKVKQADDMHNFWTEMVSKSGRLHTVHIILSYCVYRVAQNVVHVSTHHIFGTVQEKIKQLSSKCS